MLRWQNRVRAHSGRCVGLQCVAIATIIVLAASPHPGHADEVRLNQPTPGYVYFNRPGADLVAHDADLNGCIGEDYPVFNAHGVSSPISAPGSVESALEPLASDLVFNLLYAKAFQVAAAADIENCMVVRGWRVVRVPDSEGAELMNLKSTDLVTRLAAWIGADQPHGEIVRFWNNDDAHMQPNFTEKPVFFREGQLSWKIRTGDVTASPGYSRPPYYVQAKLAPQWRSKMFLRPSDLTDLSQTPADSAWIVMRVIGLDLGKGRTLGLARVGTDRWDRPSFRDHMPDLYGYYGYRNKVDWFISTVPPGRWRLTNLGGRELCLGAPAFDVKAGDVIYAGTFDLTAQEIAPDLTLDSARAYLANTPIADRLQPAAYHNGEMGLCSGGMYAYEIKGAPFAPGYAFGSRVATPSSTQSAFPAGGHP